MEDIENDAFAEQFGETLICADLCRYIRMPEHRLQTLERLGGAPDVS